MKTKTRVLFLATILACLLTSLARAQTLVSGPISGTWAPAGNPYIATDNCYVPAGTNLTIQPGVIFWIGSNLTVSASGSTITAIGTPSQRITIQAPGAASYYWNTLALTNPPTLNRFHYCDFKNAQSAITLVAAAYSQEGAEVYNCTFSNCLSQGILGESLPNVFVAQATNSPVIKNCLFSGTSNGVVMLIAESCFTSCAFGYANPIISGSIFQNLRGTAFAMTISSNPGGGRPVFLNNTVVGCVNGVSARDPWDVTIQDNIFAGCSNAVAVSGSLSRSVSYNCFYQNATNFSGYPGTYGQCLLVNRNGSLCDILFNLSCGGDPLFITPNDFHLQGGSPCINAGANSQALNNMCFPPSIGTNFGDMGAYGGPDACNWLDVVSNVPAQSLSLSVSNRNLWLSWFDVPRSTYQIQYATNLSGPVSNRWHNFSNGVAVATGTPSSFAVAPTPLTNQVRFYRIQSLGRTAGD